MGVCVGGQTNRWLLCCVSVISAMAKTSTKWWQQHRWRAHWLQWWRWWWSEPGLNVEERALVHRSQIRASLESQVKAISPYPEGHRSLPKSLKWWRDLIPSVYRKVTLAPVRAARKPKGFEWEISIKKSHQETGGPKKVEEPISTMAGQLEAWTGESFWSEFGIVKIS